jgi:hypothetical protein
MTRPVKKKTTRSKAAIHATLTRRLRKAKKAYRDELDEIQGKLDNLNYREPDDEDDDDEDDDDEEGDDDDD